MGYALFYITFFKLILWSLGNFTSYIPFQLIYLFLHIIPFLTLLHPLPKEPPQNLLKTNNKNHLFLHLSNTSSFILIALGATVCNTASMTHISLFERSHWSGSRLAAPSSLDSHYHHWTRNNTPFLSDILLLSWIIEILAMLLWCPRHLWFLGFLLLLLPRTPRCLPNVCLVDSAPALSSCWIKSLWCLWWQFC